MNKKTSVEQRYTLVCIDDIEGEKGEWGGFLSRRNRKRDKMYLRAQVLEDVLFFDTLEQAREAIRDYIERPRPYRYNDGESPHFVGIASENQVRRALVQRAFTGSCSSAREECPCCPPTITEPV